MLQILSFNITHQKLLIVLAVVNTVGHVVLTLVEVVVVIGRLKLEFLLLLGVRVIEDHVENVEVTLANRGTDNARLEKGIETRTHTKNLSHIINLESGSTVPWQVWGACLFVTHFVVINVKTTVKNTHEKVPS